MIHLLLSLLFFFSKELKILESEDSSTYHFLHPLTPTMSRTVLGNLLKLNWSVNVGVNEWLKSSEHFVSRVISSNIEFGETEWLCIKFCHCIGNAMKTQKVSLVRVMYFFLIELQLEFRSTPVSMIYTIQLHAMILKCFVHNCLTPLLNMTLAC